MNAPLQPQPQAGTPGHILSLTTAELRPSATQVQSRRRKHYDRDALSELATTIATLGVIEPIIVRPIAPPVGGKTRTSLAILIQKAVCLGPFSLPRRSRRQGLRAPAACSRAWA